MSMKSMKSVVECLADRYGFDAVEGLRWVSGGKSEVMLPFVKKVECWCDGLKNNKGLFSQCMNKPVKGESLCRGCKKQTEKHGKPTYGLASERETEGEMWRSPGGKKPVHYGNWFVKAKVDQETVISEMKRIYGMSDVSDEFFTAKKSGRGRPKKASAEVQDSDDEGSTAGALTKTTGGEAPAKKPRGRPKKENKTVVAEVETGSDLIETLITRAKSDEAPAPVETATKKTKKTAAEKEAEKEAKKAAKEAEKEAKKAAKEAEKAAKKAEKEAKKAAKEATKKAEPVVAEDEIETVVAEEEEAAVIPTEDDTADEEEDQMEVDEVEINGVKYLIDADQIVYDITTQQPIGKFDGMEVVLCEFEFEE